MGICGSTPQLTAEEKAAEAKSKDFDALMEKDAKQEQQVRKLLLLGAGEAGKSTTFKQLVQLFGSGFPPEVRKTFPSVIFSNTITSMKLLIERIPAGVELGDEAKSAATHVNELKADNLMDEKTGTAISTLWKDPAIRAAYEIRSTFHLHESAKYFFERVDDIKKPDYVPSDQDVLRARVRTTGITENEITITGSKFRIVDVGGQRAERKKWINCFQDVSCILFLVAISEYDQVLFEDDVTNRVQEALKIFDEICNLKIFQKHETMLLLFNKFDLFTEKMQRVPLSKFFPDFTGGEDSHEGVKFLENLFISKNRCPGKKIVCHTMAATETEKLRSVFDELRDVILKAGLAKEGAALA